MKLQAILFEGFETLNVFGPVEILGRTGEIDISFYSLLGGHCA